MYTLGIRWVNLSLLKHQCIAEISLPQAEKWERCPCLSIPHQPTGAAASWTTWEDNLIYFLAFCLLEFSLSGRFWELLSLWAWSTFQSCQVHKVFFLCSMFCDNPIHLSGCGAGLFKRRSDLRLYLAADDQTSWPDSTIIVKLERPANKCLQLTVDTNSWLVEGP